MISMLVATLSILSQSSLQDVYASTERWISEDYQITEEYRFDVSEHLSDEDEIIMCSHVFLEDEHETLRTVIATSTRVLVFEEGAFQREIQLEMPVDYAFSSPSCNYVMTHSRMDSPTELRSLRINTLTGEQIRFSTHPGTQQEWTTAGLHPQDDGSLLSVMRTRLSFFDTHLNLLNEIGISSPGTNVWIANDADLIFVGGITLSGFNRQGNRVWDLSDDINWVRVNDAAISSDGSLVGVACRHSVFLIDGDTGSLLQEYVTDDLVGHIMISDIGDIVVLVEANETGWFISKINPDTGVSRKVFVSSFCGENPRLRVITDNGLVLMTSRIIDTHLEPVYASVKAIRALSHSGERMVQDETPYSSEINSSFIVAAISTGV